MKTFDDLVLFMQQSGLSNRKDPGCILSRRLSHEDASARGKNEGPASQNQQAKSKSLNAEKSSREAKQLPSKVAQ
eukprot:759928-Hanusia_phi.AAC.12